MATQSIATTDFTPDSKGRRLCGLLRLKVKALPTGANVLLANPLNSLSGTTVASSTGNNGTLSSGDQTYVHFIADTNPHGSSYSGWWFYESDVNATVAPYVTIGAAGDSHTVIEHSQAYTAQVAFRLHELPVSGQYAILYTTVTDETDYVGHEFFIDENGKLRVRLIQTLLTDSIGLIGSTTLQVNRDYIAHVTYDGSRNDTGIHIYLTDVTAGTCVEETWSNEAGTQTSVSALGTMISPEQQFTVGNQQNFNRFGLNGYVWGVWFSNVVRANITNIVSWATLPALDGNHVIFQDCSRAFGSGFEDAGSAGLTVTLSGGCKWLADAPDQLAGSGGIRWVREATANTANVEITNGTGYRLTSGSFTVSCWARHAYNPNGNSGNKLGVLACDYAGGSGWALLFYTGASDHLCFYDGTAFRDSGYALTDNLWHHYAVTFDGTNYKFYVDGSLVATVAGSQPGSDTGNLLIGSWYGTGVAAWYGSLANFCIENVARSAGQVASLAVAYEDTSVFSLTSPINLASWNEATSLRLPLTLPSGVSAQFRIGAGATSGQATSAKGAASYGSASNGENAISETGQYFDIDLKLSANTAQTLTPFAASVGDDEMLLTYEAATLTPCDAEQHTYRWYDDDAALNAASPKAAADTSALCLLGGMVRLRVGVIMQAGQSRYCLQHRVDGGAWTLTTTATSPRLEASSHFADGAATTQLLTSPNAFLGGEGIETARNSAAYYSANNDAIELEFAIRMAGLDNGAQVEFRLVATVEASHGAGTVALTTYTTTPLARVRAERSMAMAVSAHRRTVGLGLSGSYGILPNNGVYPGTTNFPMRYFLVNPGGGFNPELMIDGSEEHGGTEEIDRQILTGKTYPGNISLKADAENLHYYLMSLGRCVQSLASGANSAQNPIGYKTEFYAGDTAPAFIYEELWNDSKEGEIATGVNFSQLSFSLGNELGLSAQMVAKHYLPNEYGDTETNYYWDNSARTIPTEMGGTAGLKCTQSPTMIDVSGGNHGNGVFVWKGLTFGSEQTTAFLHINGSAVEADLLPGGSLVIDLPVEQYQIAGSGFDPGQACRSAKVRVTGTLNILYKDQQIPVSALAFGKVGINLKFLGTTIAGSVRRAFEIHIPHAKFKNVPKNRDGGAVTLSLPFEAQIDASAGYAHKLTLWNTFQQQNLGGRADVLTTLASGAAANDTTISVASAANIKQFDGLLIGDAPGAERRYVTLISGTTLTLNAALSSAHAQDQAVQTWQDGLGGWKSS